MKLKYNVTGSQRKELVKTMAEILEVNPKYKGAPTFDYEVDFFTVSKDGSLDYPDGSDRKSIEKVLKGLNSAGFERETIGLTVSVPAEKVNVENLTKLLDNKGDLIQKALGVGSLPIEVEEDEDKVLFPWFEEMPDADAVTAYTHLISALCQMSQEQSRINTSSKDVENDKYTFRCFLLRLGFIGTEYKTERKILLKNLSGSSAFKDGARHEISQ